ncbi:MAG: radical SAM protein [Candidatus Omnitrophota bacterium]
MRIVLIFPAWTGEYGIFSHFARKASIWPPLNLAYIAAMAEQQNHEVKIIDGEAERLTLDEIVETAYGFNPDIIGITATTPFYHIAMELGSKLKCAGKKVSLVIGGSHITILKEKAFESYFDYAFIGEAEYSWIEFLKRYSEGGDISGVKGLFYRKDDEVFFTGAADSIMNIDSLPQPARHLLKMKNYNMGTLKGRKNFTTIMTTRGCPFKCVFCSAEVFGYRARRRSVRLVVDEIKSVIRDFGVRHFIFLDDTLTLDREYIMQICEMIEKEKLSITFEGSTRANLVDEELVAAMARNGLIRLSFGLETVDTQIRKLIKKEVPLESYTKANKITNKYKIETLNSMMLGLPGETRETVEKSLTFLKNAREIHQANFSIATPYPGTELFEMAKRGEHGLRLLTEDFSKYRRYGSAVMEVNDLSGEDLIDLQNDGFLQIYSAPWRLIPMLRKSGFLGGALMLYRLVKKFARKVSKKK